LRLGRRLRHIKDAPAQTRHYETMVRSALVLTLMSAAAPPALAQPAAVARGQRLAESVCAKCHAIGRAGDSPTAGAPRFRDLTTLNSGRSIDEIFAKGVLVLHPGMPSLAISDRDQADLLAYLRTLQRTGES
jgi:mono/diheme cytochrome c family protein